MKFLATLVALTASLAVTALPAHAEDAHAHPAKKTVKKAPAKKQAQPKHEQSAAVDEDDREPDVSTSTHAEYQCELGNKVSVYKNDTDDQHIALRWKKQLLRLTRVETTTGANRFENRKNGLVWIDIPAKAMLLDSKKGAQLANECKHPEPVKTAAQ
ncbi:hypothetical protein SAMN06265795_10422 [Noviherbaspirillum humi]|uniref:Membrane-bound lysozyme-inhibitor of c-type lysozyme n=1 Tax=Noviherbaspirillum humi TaxID=1688639 RepID=A0A239FR29_9BURK|nr:hypothetical protein [Noviherbaspirillum humi]SNS58344.1 hypothetical protein SAMN06265795_10422 [Noviherbaspirillum humi]